MFQSKIRKNSVGDVFEENFYTDADENDPAEEFGRNVEAMTVALADEQAQRREEKGCEPDDDHRLHQVDVQEGKRQTHRQRVDAGGERQRERHPFFVGVQHLLVRVHEKVLPKHPATQHEEDAEGDPMVERFDQVLEGAAGQPADQRHDGLK